MKTIKKFVVGFALAAVAVSCSKDDDHVAPVSPVSVGFSQDITVMEQNGEIDIPLQFNTPATSNGFIIVKVITEADVAFQTTPSTTAGEIEIPVNKGAAGAIIGFTPQDDNVLNEERTVTLEISGDSEWFVPAADKTLTVTITDNEAAAAATFLSAESFVEEDDLEGTEVRVWLSHPSPGEGSVTIEVEGAVAEHFSTNPPMDSNNTILLEVEEGAQEIKFRILPKDNSKISYHQSFQFTISETGGVVSKGEILNMQLTIQDDELQGKIKSETIVTDELTSQKTWEYDTEGRISNIKIIFSTNPNFYRNYTYTYNEAGQLAVIYHFPGYWLNFKWANGKVVETELIDAFLRATYSNYEYDAAGQVIKKTDYGTDDSKMAIYEYEYHSNGDLKTLRTYEPGTGNNFNLVSTLTYETYNEVFNPFPVEIIPTEISQHHLPTSFRLEEDGTNILKYYTYEYGYEDRVVKRSTTGEVTTYSYY